MVSKSKLIFKTHTHRQSTRFFAYIWRLGCEDINLTPIRRQINQLLNKVKITTVKFQILTSTKVRIQNYTGWNSSKKPLETILYLMVKINVPATSRVEKLTMTYSKTDQVDLRTDQKMRASFNTHFDVKQRKKNKEMHKKTCLNPKMHFISNK